MRYWIILCFSCFAFSTIAQDQENKKLDDFHGEGIVASFFSLIINERFEQLTIESDFSQLKEKRMDNHSQEATLSFKNPLNEVQDWEVDIEVRGNFRRRICTDMPPLKIIFPKATLRDKGFPTDYRKYKLVTHCLDNFESEQNVLKEYWTYKLYNELTPNSFRVHLMQIIYLNTADGTSTKHFGFLIEDNDELEDRIDGTMKDTWGYQPEQLHPNAYQDVLLFQYMIGNADWGVESNRNIKFIYQKNREKPIIVPYDFDNAGLVGAAYATPNVNVGQGYIGQRVVMGQLTKEQLDQGIQKFQNLTEKEWSFQDSDYLNDSTKKEMERYLKQFSRIINNRKRVERLFLE